MVPDVMLPVMDVSVISLDEDPSLFGGGGARDASSERERRVRVKDGLKKVPEFNSKCTSSAEDVSVSPSQVVLA